MGEKRHQAVVQPQLTVRNADEQLVADVKKALATNCDLKVYFAKGGFKGLSGYYASGVIEGAYHYGIFNDSD